MLEKIKDDLKEAMKARDEVRVSTLRMVLSSASNARISKGSELNEGELVGLLQKEVKLRDEAIRLSKEAGRNELAERGEKERSVLKTYLPEGISENEVQVLIDTAISEVEATGINDMGKVMGLVMPRVRGRADGNTVSRLVQERLID
jgi:uncharacterized protein